ncbi:hypothetical protein A2U01_0105184 [Trifolium medium]|uniref:Uncharacterized protein n=1 Tax=Trifolium medium TaxID=97028 RepID=A0A392V6F0_9FABA|nr:hypothetical protein [Trifolium medium]
MSNSGLDEIVRASSIHQYLDLNTTNLSCKSDGANSIRASHSIEGQMMCILFHSEFLINYPGGI